MKSLQGLNGVMLPNGLAKVIAVSQWGDSGVVLAQLNADSGKWYATWEFHRNDLATTTHGHYDMDWPTAVEDYKERIEREWPLNCSERWEQ